MNIFYNITKVHNKSICGRPLVEMGFQCGDNLGCGQELGRRCASAECLGCHFFLSFFAAMELC